MRNTPGDEIKKDKRSDLIGVVVIAFIMVACIVGGLLLSPTYKEMGFQAFGEEEATNPLWAVFYIILVVVMAVVIILLIKYKLQKLIHVAFLGAVGFTIVFVLTPMVSLAIFDGPSWETGDASTDLTGAEDPDPPLPYNLTWEGTDNFIIISNESLILHDVATGSKRIFLGPFNDLLVANVLGDESEEILIAHKQGVKIFDSGLMIRKSYLVGKNVTALSSSPLLGLKKESFITGFENGSVVFIPTGSGFTQVDLVDDAGPIAGVPIAVHLTPDGNEAFTAYFETPDSLHSVHIDYTIVPLVISGAIACIPAGIAVALLWFYPEWWVVDATGVLLAVGAMCMIGISLSILPLFILLIALAVYDAIAVYRTKHMITMASSVIEMRLPVLLVIPKSLKYSFRDQKKLKKQLEKKEERGALFIGLGDIIIPGTLVVSAFTFLSSDTVYLGIPANILVAVFTLAGIMVGYTVLMRFVLKGNPQAGLPLLNSGALLGYVISYLVLYQDLTMGFEVPTWGLGF